jgi:hypothetical protein
MGDLCVENDFEERREKLLLKALLTWLRMRFTIPLKDDVSKGNEWRTNVIRKLEGMSIYALVTSSDAWIIERNAALFDAVAKAYTRRILPDKKYNSFGGVTIAVSRKMNTVDICLVSPSFDVPVSGVVPCSMFIVADTALVKLFKDKKKDTSTQFDIIPFLKRSIPHFLSASDVAFINKMYDAYKGESEIVKNRQNVEVVKVHEDKNVEKVNATIAAQEGDKDLHTLGVLMHHVVDTSYNVDPRNVMMIKHERGQRVSVKDFSQLFVLKYNADLEEIKRALRKILIRDIKIMISGPRILFSTILDKIPDGPDEPKDPNEYMLKNHINSIVVENVEAFNHYFNMCVAPSIKIENVKRVMAAFNREAESNSNTTA